MNKGLKIWVRLSAWDFIYWSKVKAKAEELKSDGCTGVPDWVWWSCLEHDIHYRTHETLDGRSLTRAQADYIFRVRIQQASMVDGFSPMSWIRWLGVRILGKSAWKTKTKG